MKQQTLHLPSWLAASNYRTTANLVQPDFLPQQLCTDTRTLTAGDLYIPLRGEHFDGHDYLEQAFAAGAVLAVCEAGWYAEHQQQVLEWPLILVDDALKAYQSLARAWRRQLGIPVVAITGSSGKTSSKEILFQVLQHHYLAYRTQANHNNEVGVPQTLLALRPEHEICIVEMGMRGLGQIRELCEIAEPNYGLITNVGPVHLSELGSIENIAQAKWELADYLAAQEGCLVINADNPWLQTRAATFDGRLWRCGTDPDNDLTLLETHLSETGQTLTYRLQGQELTISLDLQGQHQALNLLACLGVLAALGQTLPDQTHLDIPRLSGRQQEKRLPQGPLLINDSYNANPDSMRAALQVLAARPRRRVAVLGKMAELGPEAERFHAELGSFCQTLPLDQVYVIGAEAQAILSGLAQTSAIFFTDNQEAAQALPRLLKTGDQVLFKASRSAGLEEVVSAVEAYFTQLAD